MLGKNIATTMSKNKGRPQRRPLKKIPHIRCCTLWKSILCTSLGSVFVSQNSSATNKNSSKGFHFARVLSSAYLNNCAHTICHWIQRCLPQDITRICLWRCNADTTHCCSAISFAHREVNTWDTSEVFAVGRI